MVLMCVGISWNGAQNWGSIHRIHKFFRDNLLQWTCSCVHPFCISHRSSHFDLNTNSAVFGAVVVQSIQLWFPFMWIENEEKRSPQIPINCVSPFDVHERTLVRLCGANSTFTCSQRTDISAVRRKVCTLSNVEHVACVYGSKVFYI